MRIAFLVLAAPASSAAHRALHTAQALQAHGHELVQVFFQGAAVLHARENSPWLALGAESVLCSAAVQEHHPGDLHEDSLHGFAIGGLIQLADAISRADRTLVFGP